MRRILFISAFLLVWVGQGNAADFKARKSDTEYQQNKAWLDSLAKKKRSSQATGSVVATGQRSSDPQLQSRIRALEGENRTLKQAANGTAGKRIQELEAENALLKKEIGFTTGVNKKVSSQEDMMKDRLALLARENTQLKNKVNRLKAGNLALSGESHTARQTFRDRKVAARRLLLAKKNIVEF